jgi:hypothetical protein
LKTTKSSFYNLSPHLFWDVDIQHLNIDKSKKLIIQRVLDYGLIADWQIILRTYGIAEIAETAMNIRDLDKKSASFIALLSNIPQDQFLCFTSKQSIPKHLIF